MNIKFAASTVTEWPFNKPQHHQANPKKGIDMGKLTIFRYVSQKPFLHADADVSSWWSKIRSCLYLHPYFECVRSEISDETTIFHQPYLNSAK